MKQSVVILAVSISFFFFQFASAQTKTESLNMHKWGFETEVIQPFIPEVGIIRFQATRTLYSSASKHGDLLLGGYIRPNVEHDVVEKINEYMAMVGYRQFLWKGLHIEVKSNMGYAWGTKNLIDGKDYETPTWFWESNIGYKFNLIKRDKQNLYMILQAGGIGNLVGDIGPRGGKPDNFLQAGLLLGVNF
jgi:hypothetical protein